MKLQGSTRLAGALALSTALFAACRQDMHDQPRVKVNSKSAFFADHRGNRPLVPGTVARGRLNEDAHLYDGKVDGKDATTYPFAITASVLERGRQRYGIYCQPCHGMAGDGNGMVVQRGLKHPPSFHSDRLRNVAPGYVYSVITNGFGQMFDYSDRVKVEDRWAIVAYIHALQMSQDARVADVPQSERAHLDALENGALPEPAGEHGEHGAMHEGGAHGATTHEQGSLEHGSTLHDLGYAGEKN